MSLLTPLITVFTSVVSTIIPTPHLSIDAGSSPLDFIYGSRWEQAPEHNVTSNVFIPSYVTSGGLSPYSDNYECNDNYDDATLICPANVSTVFEYKATVSASLNFVSEMGDVDFYVLPLLSDSHVTVSTNSSNGHFSFEIVSDTYSGVNNGIATQEHETVFYDDTNSYYKHCSFNLKAGTYYLIYDNLCDQRFDYTFNVSVTKNPRDLELDITEARHYKHAGAALWISDLAHRYLPHYLYAGEDITIYKNGYNGILNHRDAAFEVVESLIGDEPFVLSEVLIWDCGIINNLVKIIDVIRGKLSDIEDAYSYSDRILLFNNQFHFIFDKIAGTVSLTVDILNIPLLSFVVEVATGVVDILCSIVPLIVPQAPVSLSDYHDYLNSLASYLNYLDDHIGGLIEKPIKIPCFVSIKREGLSTIKLDYSYNGYFYNSSNFTNFTDYSVSAQTYQVNPARRGYCSGTFYLIKEDGQSLTLGTQDSIDSYIEINQLTNSYGLPVSVLPQYCDEWFSYTPSITGTHSFVLASAEDELGQMEIHTNTFIYPQSQTPLNIATYTFDGHLCLSTNLTQGQTVYVRVCGTNNGTYSGGAISVYEGALSPLTHLYHNYTYSYADLTADSHKAFCECGAMTLRPHVQSETWTSGRVVYSRCGLCGGVHSGGRGFIGLNTGGDYE